MEVGTVTTAGFVGSTETLASFESRLRAEWSVSSPPFVPGEICWLRLTERGAPLAKQALERGGREALTLSGTEDGVAAAEAALRAASAADDEQTRNARLDDAVALLRRATTEKPSAEGLYLLGYAQYLHEGARVPGAVREASKSALREALRLNPRHAAAHLYLGHHAYDEGRYDDARLELELGKLEPTNDELDDYFEVKRREMLLCCEVQTKGIAGALCELESFADCVEERSVFDIHPINLVRQIETRRVEIASMSSTEYERLAKLAARIDRAGSLGDWLVGIVVAARLSVRQ